MMRRITLNSGEIRYTLSVREKFPGMVERGLAKSDEYVREHIKQYIREIVQSTENPADLRQAILDILDII